MTDWAALDIELARWRECGQVADVWLRDDDASRDGPALRALRDVTVAHAVPVLLAVIPARLDASLHDAVDAWAGCSVGVHGFAHESHAPPGEKKAEFGGTDALSERVGELARGATVLRNGFAERFVPVFVPPWNRVHPAVVRALPQVGLAGLSTFKARTARSPARGVIQVNTHVDIIDWRGTRGFVGEAAALGALVAHLELRRRASGHGDSVIGAEATGVMTHHAVHDRECNEFLANLFTFLAGRDDVRWIDPVRVFS